MRRRTLARRRIAPPSKRTCYTFSDRSTGKKTHFQTAPFDPSSSWRSQFSGREQSGRQFFVEESYTLAWMAPYLEPSGVLLRLHHKPVELSPNVIEADQRYWAALSAQLLASAEFGQDIQARKTFSKMRTAIAGVYAARGKAAEAEDAFKQAIALDPLSPEANFRLGEFFVHQKRGQDAEDIISRYQSLNPGDAQAGKFLKQLSAMLHTDSQSEASGSDGDKVGPGTDSVTK